MTRGGSIAAVRSPSRRSGFLFVGAHGEVSKQQSQLVLSQAEIAALPQPTKPQIDASLAGDRQRGQPQSRASSEDACLGVRVRDLSRVLPGTSGSRSSR